MTPRHWIGVDLDGTLALSLHSLDGDLPPGSPVPLAEVGQPVPEMVERVRRWLAEGRVVKVFTARVADDASGEYPPGGRRAVAEPAVRAWCLRHLGVELEVVATKDRFMEELWDDRAVGVVRNTGEAKEHAAKHRIVRSTLENCAAIMRPQYRGRELWALAVDVFGVGSTTAVGMCRGAGLDPHQKVGSGRLKAPGPAGPAAASGRSNDNERKETK